jgi:hypothetical protein
MKLRMESKWKNLKITSSCESEGEDQADDNYIDKKFLGKSSDRMNDFMASWEWKIV